MTTTTTDPLARMHAAEKTATTVRCHATRRTPGYPQCPELTTAIHTATHRRHPLAVTAEDLTERQEQRRARMRASQRTSTTVLLDEELLHRVRNGYGADIARAQLRYLYAGISGMADWFGGDKTTIRIIPRGYPSPLPPDEFTMVAFGDTAQQDFVCVEATCGIVGALDAQYLTADWQLEQVWETWVSLEEEALDHDRTLHRLDRLLGTRS
jgi:Domain of unknown function (DUF5753)